MLRYVEIMNEHGKDFTVTTLRHIDLLYESMKTECTQKLREV
jgi:hypothetical protein